MSDGLKLIINLDFKGNEELEKLINEIKKQHNLNISIDKDTVETPLNEVKKTGNSVIQSLTSGFSALGLSMLGIKDAANIIKNAFLGIVGPADTFEQLRIRLVNLYGDAKKAGEVFETFKNIAKTTPFELDDVANAGATLKAFGLNAEDSLKSIADLAAFMGTDVTEAANAVGRAFAGGAAAADVLRERGVLELIKSFSGIDDLTKLTLPQFREAMISAFQDPALGIAGSTDRLADSYTGAISNMKDAWTAFRAELGNKALPALKQGAVAVSDFLSAFTPSNMEKTKEETQKNIVQYQILTSVLRNLGDVTNGTDSEKEQFKNTITKLNEQYGSFLGNLDTSITKYSELSSAIESAKNKLFEEAAAKVVLAETEDEAQDIVKLKLKIESYRTMIAQIDLKIKETNQKMTAFIAENNNIATKAMGYNETQLKQVIAGMQAGIDAYKSNIDQAENEIKGKTQKIQDLYNQTQKVLQSLTKSDKTKPDNHKGDNSTEEAEDQTKLQYEKELELLNLKRQNNYDVLEDLSKKYDDYFAYLKNKYGQDSIEYQQALKAKNDLTIVPDNTDKIMIQYEKELELLNLKRQNNYDVVDDLQIKYDDYFSYLKDTYGQDSLEYQKVLNQKLASDRDYALKQANFERQKLYEKKEMEQAVWDFEQNLLELDDPETVRLNNQKRQLERFFNEKKDLLIKAGVDEKRITDAKEKSITALELDSLNRRLQAHASGLGQMANNMSQLGKTGFQVSKALNTAQVIMETPAAAMAAYRSVVGIPVIGPVLAPIAFATAIATGMMQLKAIAQAKPPQAEKGGLSGLLAGPSHSNGGIIIEAEGQEYITNKKRVNELGVDFFDFLNFAPLDAVKQAFSTITIPRITSQKVPSPVMASGGSINTGLTSNMDFINELRVLKNEMITEIAGLKEAYEKKQLVVQNVISANEIIKKADPVLLSYSTSKGNSIRSGL